MSPLPDVQTGSREPLYNIGVVSKLTGLSMATLRAWERRYDFPEAERTAGGHRLYSERDVMRLRWVKARINEGMQTSQAIQALLHQEETGHVVNVEELPAEISVPSAGLSEAFHNIEQQLLGALVERNIEAADRILGEVLAVSSPDDIILDLIAPTLDLIGKAWEEGEVTVATEHLASNYLRQRLLMWMVSGPPPRTTRPVVLACAPNEWHEGSLLCLGALLRRRRWPVAYLGQAVPLEDLGEFVRSLDPPLIVLVAMTEETARELVKLPDYLPMTGKENGLVISYGGRVFTLEPEWRLRVPGLYLGDTLRQGLQTIERLLQ
jgi:DNA-binding transcriptional MerR regulator